MTSPEPTPSPDGVTAPPATTSRPAWRSWTIASMVTALVVVAAIWFLDRSDTGTSAAATETTSTAPSAAATDQPTGGPGGPGAGFGAGGAGEVSAVDGTTLTIESSDRSGGSRTMTVVASAETTVSETVAGTLDDLAVGDEIVVVGEESDAGITARSITMGGSGLDAGFGGGPGGPGGSGGTPPEGFEPPEGMEPPDGFEPPEGAEAPDGMRPPGAGGFVTGEITAVTDTTVILETTEGESVVVTVEADLTVELTQERTLADIEVGDTIRAFGTTEDDRVEATRIIIGDLLMGPGERGGFGG